MTAPDDEVKPAWKPLGGFMHVDPTYWSMISEPGDTVRFDADDKTDPQFRKPCIEIGLAAGGKIQVFEDFTLLSAQIAASGREVTRRCHISNPFARDYVVEELLAVARSAHSMFLEASRELAHAIAIGQIRVWGRWNSRRSPFVQVPRDAWQPDVTTIDWEAGTALYRDGERLCSIHVDRVQANPAPAPTSKNRSLELRTWARNSIAAGIYPTKEEFHEQGRQLGLSKNNADLVRMEIIETSEEREKLALQKRGPRQRKPSDR